MVVSRRGELSTDAVAISGVIGEEPILQGSQITDDSEPRHPLDGSVGDALDNAEGVTPKDSSFWRNYAALEVVDGVRVEDLGNASLKPEDFGFIASKLLEQEALLAEEAIKELGEFGVHRLNLAGVSEMRDQGVPTLGSPLGGGESEGFVRFVCPDGYLERLRELQEVHRVALELSGYREYMLERVEREMSEEYPELALSIHVSPDSLVYSALDATGSAVRSYVIPMPGI